MNNSQPQNIIITPVKLIERLKQRARKLKREKNIPHNEALDLIAKENGLYNHWHHVTECASITAMSEQSVKSGLLIAFDMKEADEIGNETENFIYDEQASYFLEKELKNNYENFIESDIEYNPQGKTNKELLSKSELEEDFYFFLQDLVFYRYTPRSIPQSINIALPQINDICFWPPMFIWLRGEFYETSNLPAVDNNGNVVGVRF